jgi:hypothetical protein
MRGQGFHKMLYHKADICHYMCMCINCGKTVTITVNGFDEVYDDPKVLNVLKEVCPKTKIKGWTRTQLKEKVELTKSTESSNM